MGCVDAPGFCITSRIPRVLLLSVAIALPDQRRRLPAPHPFLKPRLGILRWKGVCPPSNPILLAPLRALDPLWPLPHVFPVPDPMPLPTRFLSLVAPSFGARLFSRRGGEKGTDDDTAAAPLSLRKEIASPADRLALVAIAAEYRASIDAIAGQQLPPTKRWAPHAWTNVAR